MRRRFVPPCLRRVSVSRTLSMSQVHVLRTLVQQRLSAAAEDIAALFERTVTEYEEQLSRCREEAERQRRLLRAAFNPEVRLHCADVQQLLVKKETVEHEQQQRSFHLDQESQEHPQIKVEQEDQDHRPIKEEQEDQEYRPIKKELEDQEDQPIKEELDDQEDRPIKEEQEEVWTSQEEVHLQDLQEVDVIKFTFSPVHVKSEDDEEEPQSSQVYHSQPEEDRDSVGRPELDTEDMTPQPVKMSDVLLSDTEEKPFGCAECGHRFRQKGHLQIHMRCHTGEKPFSCSVCAKRFPRKENLVRHMRFHSGEKPFSCSFCKKHFTRSDHAVTHMRIHTGEKPYTCSVCGRRFTHKLSLKHHMFRHSEQRGYSCSVCHRTFSRITHVRRHKCVFSSSEADLRAVTIPQT